MENLMKTVQNKFESVFTADTESVQIHHLYDGWVVEGRVQGFGVFQLGLINGSWRYADTLPNPEPVVKAIWELIDQGVVTSPRVYLGDLTEV
jgi:hypothetical protein